MRYEKIEFMILLNLFISGTFSSVFQAKLRNHPKVDQLFALKHIIPTSHPSRIETELKCLQQLGYQIFVKFIAILICFLFNFFNFKHSIFSRFSTFLINLVNILYLFLILFKSKDRRFLLKIFFQLNVLHIFKNLLNVFWNPCCILRNF